MKHRAVFSLCVVLVTGWAWYAGAEDTTRADADAPEAGDAAKLEQTPDGNVVLYVSNQSSATNPVDIKVTIDGRMAVDQSFDFAGNGPAGHNWKKFVFRLDKGPHELKAVSAKGGAVLTKRFEVKDKHWAVIDYWHNPRARGASDAKKHFTFRIQNTPIHFM